MSNYNLPALPEAVSAYLPILADDLHILILPYDA